MLELLDTYVNLKQDNADNQEVRALVAKALGTKEAIKLRSLTGGITNQLLKAETPSQKALVRLFGRGTSTFINREREYAVHLRLASLGMAAPLYCRFGNGLIYGWADGSPATYTDLSDPRFAPAIAKRLGEWHKSLRLEDIPFDSTIFDAISSWIDLVPNDTVQLTRAELHAELEWFVRNFSEKGGPTVMGHNDLLCGNILLPNQHANTQHPENLEVQFIDYEYAQRCPRAFDIANHFMEWQGYDCDVAKIPDLGSEMVRDWLTVYLKASGSTDRAEDVVEEVRAYWGMPGFYWGIWAAIQSTQSEIDFDYKAYAGLRFGEYLRWRAKATGDQRATAASASE